MRLARLRRDEAKGVWTCINNTDGGAPGAQYERKPRQADPENDVLWRLLILKPRNNFPASGIKKKEAKQIQRERELQRQRECTQV